MDADPLECSTGEATTSPKLIMGCDRSPRQVGYVSPSREHTPGETLAACDDANEAVACR